MGPQEKRKQETEAKPEVFVEDKVDIKVLEELVKTTKEKIIEQILEYAMVGEQARILQARQKIIRPYIEHAIDEQGQEDSKGHVHLGQIEVDGVEAIRQKRRNVAFNAIMAEQIVKDLGLWDLCVDREEVHTIKETLNTDKIEQAFEAGLIPQNLFDNMFTESVISALVVNVDESVHKEYANLKALRKALENEAKAEETKFHKVE